MKAFSKENKLKALISPKMTDVITFIYNNIKPSVYTGGNIHGLYCYLEMIGYPTTLNASDHLYHNFGLSYYTNYDTSNIQPVIAASCMIWKSICECRGSIGHKADDCIIHGPDFLPPSIRLNKNQFRAVHDDEKTEP